MHFKVQMGEQMRGKEERKEKTVNKKKIEGKWEQRFENEKRD